MQNHNVLFFSKSCYGFKKVTSSKSKSKDENSEKKRPTGEGASLKPPLPRQEGKKFRHLFITLTLG